MIGIMDFHRRLGVWSRLRDDMLTSQSLEDQHIIDNIICLVTSCGGFVAGGFARIVTQTDEPNWFNQNNGKSIDRLTHLKMYLSNFGDIDVFFPDNVSFSTAVRKLTSHLVSGRYRPARKFHIAASALGNAVNFYIDSFDFGRIKVQLVHKEFGTIESVVGGFDFVNSMAAIDGDDIIVADGWEELEESKTLDVRRTDSLFCVSRVKKYVKRYGYRHLTPSGSDIVTRRIGQIHDILTQEGPIMSVYRSEWSRPSSPISQNSFMLKYDEAKLINEVAHLIKRFENDDLLALFGILDQNADNVALKELLRRAQLINDPKRDDY